MTMVRWLGVALFLGGLLGGRLVEPAQAQEKAIKKDDAYFYGRITRDLVTAAAVAEYGREYKAPEAMLAAAGLLLKANAYTGGKIGTFTRDDVEEAKDEEGKPLEKPSAETSFDKKAEDLIVEAELMTKNPRQFQVQIKALRSRDYTKTEDYQAYKKLKERKTRAVLGGPKQLSRKLQAGGSHHYTFRFVSHEPGVIAMQSSAPVRFRVVAPGIGELVNTVVTNGRYSWVPKGKETTNIKVEIHGMGRLAQYSLFAN